VGREPLAALAQPRAPAHAEEIRHLHVVERGLGQGGVEPILERGALTDERHPRPRPLALVHAYLTPSSFVSPQEPLLM
jgi:hypothetical protein